MTLVGNGTVMHHFAPGLGDLGSIVHWGKEGPRRPDPEKAPFVRAEAPLICPDCTWPSQKLLSGLPYLAYFLRIFFPGLAQSEIKSSRLSWNFDFRPGRGSGCFKKKNEISSGLAPCLSSKFPQNPSGSFPGLPYHYPGSWQRLTHPSIVHWGKDCMRPEWGKNWHILRSSTEEKIDTPFDRPLRKRLTHPSIVHWGKDWHILRSSTEKKIDTSFDRPRGKDWRILRSSTEEKIHGSFDRPQWTIEGCKGVPKI